MFYKIFTFRVWSQNIHFFIGRLHKVIWGGYGVSSGEYKSGIIIGGTDNGHIYVYNAGSIIAGDESNAIALQLDKHTGPVQALDINAFQENLLASGKHLLAWA